MLDPQSLQAFIAVAEMEHFVRAADRLGVAQSVVSKRLKRLEDQLETRLVERGRRNKVALTRAGEMFLPEARAGLASLERLEQLGRNYGRGLAGPLRVGYIFSAIMAGVLPRIIRVLGTSIPGLEVQPHSLETPEQILAVHDGKLDLGLARPRPTYPEHIKAVVIHREDVIVALARDHPLATQDRLGVRDIISQRIIVPQFHEEVGLVDVIRGVAAAAGVRLPEIQRTSNFITAAGLVAAGTGIAIAPRSLERLCLDDICFREIADHAASLDLVAIFRTDIPATLRDIVEGMGI